MTNVIHFPDAALLLRREMESIFEEKFGRNHQELRDCVIKAIQETFEKYPKLPSMQFSAEVSLDPEEQERISSALSEQYNENLTPFVLEFMKEICLLKIELCKIRNGE